VEALNIAGCVGWLRSRLLSNWESEDVMIPGLQVGLHADKRSLNGAANRACAHEVDTIKEWEYGREMFALVAAFWGEIWVGNILVVFSVMIAFSMTDEVNCAWGHDGTSRRAPEYELLNDRTICRVMYWTLNISTTCTILYSFGKYITAGFASAKSHSKDI
jgi:hypothetical protein